MKKILLTIVFAVMFFGGCNSSNADNPENNTSKQQFVFGYLPSWKMPYNPQWQKITHLCIAFGIVNADGSLDVSDIGIFAGCIVNAHNNNVKVLLSIGGGGSNNFSEAILNDNRRAFLIENLDKAVKDFNLDGIDIDFEEWEGGLNGASQTDLLKRDALEKLYKELREKIGSQKLITAAVTASWNNGGWGFYNCFNNTMHQYLDFVSLMIYDETGPWSGTTVGQHASWNFFIQAINHWLNNRKLPKEKLVAGVPFYGYLFKSPNNAANAEGIAYSDILTRYPNQDAHIKDNIDLLYYNGMETIRNKAKYVADNDLAGIMIWELSQDTNIADKSLLNVIYETLK
jgi:GH18 family chitinase